MTQKSDNKCKFCQHELTVEFAFEPDNVGFLPAEEVHRYINHPGICSDWAIKAVFCPLCSVQYHRSYLGFS